MGLLAKGSVKFVSLTEAPGATLSLLKHGALARFTLANRTN